MALSDLGSQPVAMTANDVVSLVEGLFEHIQALNGRIEALESSLDQRTRSVVDDAIQEHLLSDEIEEWTNWARESGLPNPTIETVHNRWIKNPNMSADDIFRQVCEEVHAAVASAGKEEGLSEEKAEEVADAAEEKVAKNIEGKLAAEKAGQVVDMKPKIGRAPGGVRAKLYEGLSKRGA